MGSINIRGAKRTTDGVQSDSGWYDLPVVVHVIHDFGAEYLSDDEIYHNLNQWNAVYAGANRDTSQVIAPFKKWVGNPRIRLHLATKDRFGNPTKGITRHRSYLTYSGTDQSKLDDWPSTSYINIWFVNGLQAMGGLQPAAYAFFPSSAASLPFWDGVICTYNYISTDKTINHECGHMFNLIHVWGNDAACAAGLCADGGSDEVDDTPPTIGHLSCKLYDTNCATGYFKVYPSVLSPGSDSLVDYPDTTNTQNIMDYSYCDRMFTIGQTVRMHAALEDPTAGRSNLWDSLNLVLTGALDPRPDMLPVPDFAASDTTVLQGGVNFSGSVPVKYFIGTADHPKARIRFLNQSWNDTVSYVRWQFSNGALISDVTTASDSVIKDTTSDDAPNFLPSSYTRVYKSTVVNGFTQPGWVNLTMTVTDTSGASAGRVPNVATKSFPNAVFVADATGVQADSYFQEFNPGGDLAKWPMFNYYNNEFHWTIDSTHGYRDHYCMAYTGFDTRVDPGHNIMNFTGSPGGDYDDFFSVPFDLSGFGDTGNCYLNFMYSGASRSANMLDVNDRMIIEASADGGTTWYPLTTMVKNTLESKGSSTTAYAPSVPNDWSPMSVSIPADARLLRGDYTVFRFRYFPGNSASTGLSSGNNFYLDRLSFSRYTTEVSNLLAQGVHFAISPNPTNGSAFVVLDNGVSTDLLLTVADITGKTVYKLGMDAAQGKTVLEIPKSALSVAGLYLVQLRSGNETLTQKLVVY